MTEDRTRDERRATTVTTLLVAALIVVGLLVVGLLPARASAAQPADDAAGGPPPVRVATPTAALTEADVTAWLDGVLPARLEAAGVPGAQVAVVADGRVLVVLTRSEEAVDQLRAMTIVDAGLQHLARSGG